MKRLRILAITLSLVVLLTTLFGCGPKSVTFPDENLEAAIRDALGKPVGEEIAVEELSSLTTLLAENSDINDLTGLEYCTNLTELLLHENKISDILPLVENSGLSEGDTVNLVDNPLSIESVNVYIPQLEERGVHVIY